MGYAMKYKWFISLLIAAIAASFGAGYSLKKIQTVYVDVPKTVTDTLYVAVDKVIYKHLPAKHDTLWADLVHVIHDTTEITDVAAIDTVLESGGVKYGQILIAYYPRPMDWFNIEFAPAPLPTITITKYIETKRRWYAHPLFTLSAGVLTGVAITQITK
jgi:hypothetical protein